MRVLFTTFPAFGHLHPVVPLALAARSRGHDVRLATGPNLISWVRRCTLEAIPIGLSEDAAAQIADRDYAGPDRTDRMFADVWPSAAVPDLLDATRRWRPDLVIHEEEEYAGVLLAAMLDIPCVTHSWSAPARGRAGRAAALEMLEATWERHLPGTTPRRVGEIYLDACPPAFQTEDIHDIAQVAQVINVRPSLYDGPPDESITLPADIRRPAAYLTFGTVPAFSTPARLRNLATVLAPMFASIVVTTGPNPIESLGDLPANVKRAQYLPQSIVLPSVDLVVSHGGAGGSVGALMHGLAHLVLPGRGQSQVTTADAVQRLGAGLRLREPDRQPATVRAAVERLVREPDFARVARMIRAQLLRLPDPDETFALLEARRG